jgi:hypothetical protein
MQIHAHRKAFEFRRPAVEVCAVENLDPFVGGLLLAFAAQDQGKKKQANHSCFDERFHKMGIAFETAQS